MEFLLHTGQNVSRCCFCPCSCLLVRLWHTNWNTALVNLLNCTRIYSFWSMWLPWQHLMKHPPIKRKQFGSNNNMLKWNGRQTSSIHTIKKAAMYSSSKYLNYRHRSYPGSDFGHEMPTCWKILSYPTHTFAELLTNKTCSNPSCYCGHCYIKILLFAALMLD